MRRGDSQAGAHRGRDVPARSDSVHAGEARWRSPPRTGPRPTRTFGIPWGRRPRSGGWRRRSVSTSSESSSPWVDDARVAIAADRHRARDAFRDDDNVARPGHLRVLSPATRSAQGGPRWRWQDGRGQYVGEGEAKSLGITVGFSPDTVGSADVPAPGLQAATAPPIMSAARMVSSVFRRLVKVHLLCVPDRSGDGSGDREQHRCLRLASGSPGVGAGSQIRCGRASSVPRMRSSARKAVSCRPRTYRRRRMCHCPCPW